MLISDKNELWKLINKKADECSECFTMVHSDIGEYNLIKEFWRVIFE